MNSIPIRLALRNLIHDKQFTIINVIGLTLGIACFAIVALYIYEETTFDRHNENFQRIYRAINEFSTDESSQPYRSALTSVQLGPMMERNYPLIEQYVRFREIPNTGRQVLVTRENDDSTKVESFYWDSDRILLADANVFSVFTHRFIHGSSFESLEDPDSVVISQSLATKYFGNENPVGEMIAIARERYFIQAVFEDLPRNSHLQYDALLSIDRKSFTSSESPQARLELGYPQVFTYFLLTPGVSEKEFGKIGEDFVQSFMTGDGFTGYSTRIYAEALSSLYLYSNASEGHRTANLAFIYSIGLIGVLILIIACINYINLATARSTRLQKSLGIQRLLGSSRSSIFAQFIIESLVLSSIAFAISITLAELVLAVSPIPSLLGKQSMSLVQNEFLMILLLILILVIGALSSLYPALSLSASGGLSSVVLQAERASSKKVFRTVFVLVQFTVSVIVLICVLVMYQQTNYLNSRSLGFDKTDKLTLRITGVDQLERVDTLINSMISEGSVSAGTVATAIPGQSIPYQPGMGIENNDGVLVAGGLRRIGIDESFLDVLGIELVAGRNLDSMSIGNGIPLLVNETAVEAMNWNSAIGKRLRWNGNEGTIIGVVEDFNFQGLHNQIEPLFLFPQQLGVAEMNTQQRSRVDRTLVLDIGPGSYANALEDLRNTWSDFDPDTPLSSQSIEDSLNNLYVSEQTQLRLVGLFSVLCISLSCLGLYGLTAFINQQRTKEIGIRKVLGAQSWQILQLLFSNTLTLMLCATLIASPIAWIAALDWLNQFYYRIELTPLVFLLAAMLASTVALSTVAAQSYSMMRRNPVEALRYE